MPVLPAVRLVTERLVVALPGPEAAPQVLAYFVDNRAHLEPWGPPVPDEFYTVGFHAERLLRARDDLLGCHQTASKDAGNHRLRHDAGTDRGNRGRGQGGHRAEYTGPHRRPGGHGAHERFES